MAQPRLPDFPERTMQTCLSVEECHKVQAVICDLFDVLFLAGDPTRHREYETRLGLPERGLRQAMVRSPSFVQALRGQITEEQLWRDVAQSIGDDPTQWSMIADTFYSAVRVNEVLADFLRSLRPHYRTAILSNAPDGIRAWIQRFHLDQAVDEIIISAEVQVSKPYPDIFQLAAHRLGVQPQEAIFIDDEPRFIAGAQAVGMTGVLFTDTAQAIAQVQAYLDQHTAS
jgi:HAD superfamily hydrolase (TIGR01509 family)